MINSKLVRTMAVLLSGIFLLSVSGCEKIVQSAVIAEKEEQEKQGDSSTEGESSASPSTPENLPQAENAKASGVSAQVQAPERYQADFTDEAGDGQMKIHVTANAPVEVPDVDAILLRQVKPSKGDAERIQQWISTLSKGEKAEEVTENIEGTNSIATEGRVSVEGIPFEYRAQVLVGDYISISPNFSWRLDFEAIRSTLKECRIYGSEKREPLTEEEEEFLSQASAGVGTLQEELKLDDYCLSGTSFVPSSYIYADGREESGKVGFFRFERMVDGIPVTYVLESVYPLYKDPETLQQPKGESASGENTENTEGLWQWWDDDSLLMNYLDENVIFVGYTEANDVSTYSDEKQFLLPFDEIRQVFENTMAAQLTGPGREALIGYPELFVYPNTNVQSVEIEITKVKLGYMRIREEGSTLQGILIPVWDFFGTWKASGPSEDGTMAESTLEEPDVSLFTVDARDGSVIQRYRGY